MENNFSDLEVKVSAIKKSYISKEKFIEMINSIDFVAVKYYSIDFLTGIIADGKTGEIKECRELLPALLLCVVPLIRDRYPVLIFWKAFLPAGSR